jgi:signal peptidase I
MQFKPGKAKAKEKLRSGREEWIRSIVFAVVVATLIRWTAVEAFVVPTASMENTILVGDFLIVSKFHYGTRTTSTPLQIPLTHQKIWGTNIPSFLDWITLPTYRLPGISEVQRGDVVVFNVPPREMNDGVDYPVQLKTNYVKRCVGVPGDRLEIKDKLILVNSTPLAMPMGAKFRYVVLARDDIAPRNLRAWGLDKNDYAHLGRMQEGTVAYRMLLTGEQRELLQTTATIISVTEDPTTQDGPDKDIFPVAEYAAWNGDNYGPLTIPKKGMTIDINDSTLACYGELIRAYEPGGDVEVKAGRLVRDGQIQPRYTFQQDYFFMMGDNRHNSLDSRYWGFVPKDHIVGKALMIWLSVDEEENLLHKIRWKRLFTTIQ